MPLSHIIFQDASKQVCQNFPLSAFLVSCFHNELRTSMVFHSFSCWSLRTPRNKGQSHASPCTAQWDKTRSAFFAFTWMFVWFNTTDQTQSTRSPRQLRFVILSAGTWGERRGGRSSSAAVGWCAILFFKQNCSSSQDQSRFSSD